MEKNLTTGSVFGNIVRFSLPYLLSYFLQTLYGMADLFIIGWYEGVAGTTAVAIGSQVMHMLTVMIVGLAMGATVTIGQAVGARDRRGAAGCIGNTTTLFLALSVVLTGLLLALARPIAAVMSTPAEAVPGTVAYLRICFLGVPLITAYNIIASIFRGLGDSKRPMYFIAIACAANIALDYLFMGALHMGPAGAALGTTLAQAVSVVLSLVIIRRQDLPFTVKRSQIRFNQEIRNFVIIGAPIALQEFLTNLSFLALCAFINRLGLDASSGYGVANKIVVFIMLVPSSLMQSMASFVAQNVGAGLEMRSRKAMACGMGIGAFVGVFITYISFFHGDMLAAIFTNEPAVIARAAEYLRGFAPEAVVTSVLFSFMGYFNGHSRTFFVMMQGLAQSFLVRLPMSYLMSIQPNASLTMIGLAAPSATVFGICINAAYFLYYTCLLYTSPSPRDSILSRMPSSA